MHMSGNNVCNEICHEYIHVMGWTDIISKQKATFWNLAYLSSCCEQGAAGLLRAFPAHVNHPYLPHTQGPPHINNTHMLMTPLM